MTTAPLFGTDWTPDGWRAHPAAQQPDWPDPAALDAALDELRRLPPLVFAGEARNLTEALAAAHDGSAFLLVAGDCAESFEAFCADGIRDKLKIILQMSVVLTYGSGVPTLKVGRMAGQFSKPRSSPTETRNGLELPSFRGDTVNDFAFDAAARRPDPARLVRAYHQSASTLNLARAFTKGGFADLSRVHAWNQEFVGASPEGERYEALADEIERALRFMAACGIDLNAELQLHQVDFWTAHEALLLGYEEALTRRDSITDDWYDCSAHLLWLGERTRQLDGAHVEFLSGVRNPLGVKLGPGATPHEVVALCERLNPRREPGRLVLFSRMGADAHRRRAPAAPAGRQDVGPSGRVGLRPDARQHVPARVRVQDPRLRRRHGRARTASSPRAAALTYGRAACTSSSPARTSPSASAAARRCSRTSSNAGTRRCATRGSTHASRSTSRSSVAELLRH